MKDKREKAAPVYDVVRDESGFAIHRNGRYLMTPAGSAYRMPTQGLADEVTQEWRAQGEKINPASMPLTQLVATTLDLVGKDRGKTTRSLLGFVGSELLCHRVETPSSLVRKQNEQWQPFLDWIIQRYDVHFATGSGVMPIAQPSGISNRLETVLDSLDDFRLTGLNCAADAAGSLVLGLALAEGFATAETVFLAAELDFAHQAVTWGDDPVTKARQDSIRADLDACEKWFTLLG